MTKFENREQQLLDALKANKKLSTQTAADILNISESSVRRLFTKLESGGKIVRVYGGIKLANENNNHYSFESLKNSYSKQKEDIALKAYELIEENDVIYMDCGTTLYQLALVIADKLESGELNNIKIVTNSLANMEVLHNHCQVILSGGIYDSNRKDFSGYFSEMFIKQFNYSKSFLGTDGYIPSEGFMALDDGIAKLNKIVIEHSKNSYVLADSSKAGKYSFVKYADTAQITAVITDNLLNKNQENDCIDADLKILK